MRIRAGHVLHPGRTVRKFGALAHERLERWQFAKRGARQFAADARYTLSAVREGFADHQELNPGDEEHLERICSAFQKAYADERHSSAIYRPTFWWEQQRHGSLQPVMNALAHGDIKKLGRMYRNFYRDACSAGLIVVQSLAREYFGGRMSQMNQRYILADALCRVNYWAKVTNGAFAIEELRGPAIGNPFGVMVEGSFVRVGSPFQHYCAARVAEQLAGEEGTVAEIGGGYGGMAYYLLRDRPQVRYVDFDVAESVALTAYFLMRAFPEKKFLLYGEAALEEADDWDVALLPVFALPRVPLVANVTFSSHAMTDLCDASLQDYVTQALAITRGKLICIGEGSGVERFKAESLKNGGWDLEQEKTLAWSSHTNAQARERELIYRNRA